MTSSWQRCLFALYRFFFIAAFIVLLASYLCSTVQAESEKGFIVYNISQQDVNGDGQPDITIIHCSFATPNDQVLVFDRAGNMRISTRWEEATDFSDDLWVFDVGADGLAELVISFYREERNVIAELYDDQDGDGHVNYDQSRKAVTESPYWTVRVVAEEGWRHIDGTLNFAIHILIDGKVPVMHRGEFGFYEIYLNPDGQPDGEILTVDEDGDRNPDWQLRRFLIDIPPNLGVKQSGIVANYNPDPPPEYKGYIFWPYLGRAEAYKAGSYTNSPPPILVNWRRAKIAFLRSVIPGYPLERGWFLNVHQRIEENSLNVLSFENPMAYYDLANDHDGLPELHVRNMYLPPHSPYFQSGRFTQPVQMIRYSWNQSNRSGGWEYALHMQARNSITTVLTFGSFIVQAIPYEQVPYWATEQPIDIAIFVAVEGEPLYGEGIYERGGVLTLLNRYLTGLDDKPPWEPETALSVFEGGPHVGSDAYSLGDVSGLRIEYNLTLQAQPYLYFSPIDRRLHLLRAEYGVWDINNRAEIHFVNIDSDLYLDRWEYYENGERLRQLISYKNWLLYADRREILLKRSNVPSALFETLPPRNHEEWLALGRQLEAHRRDFAPDDFEAMVAQFEGPETRIFGARMRDFRPTDNGFRFVLTLMPGFWVTAGSDWLGVQVLSPGEYVVTYDGSAFHVKPLTPARAEIVPGSLRLSNPEPAELEPVQIEVTLYNAGLEDLASLPVYAWAARSNSPVQPVGTVTVTLLAGQAVPVRFNWTPQMAGEWHILLAWGAESARPLSITALPQASVNILQVVSRPPVPMATIWRISNVSQPLALAGFLAAFGLAAATLMLAILQSMESEA